MAWSRQRCALHRPAWPRHARGAQWAGMQTLAISALRTSSSVSFSWLRPSSATCRSLRELGAHAFGATAPPTLQVTATTPQKRTHRILEGLEFPGVLIKPLGNEVLVSLQRGSLWHVAINPAARFSRYCCSLLPLPQLPGYSREAAWASILGSPCAYQHDHKAHISTWIGISPRLPPLGTHRHCPPCCRMPLRPESSPAASGPAASPFVRAAS